MTKRAAKIIAQIETHLNAGNAESAQQLLDYAMRSETGRTLAAVRARFA